MLINKDGRKIAPGAHISMSAGVLVSKGGRDIASGVRFPMRES
ncbi:hypothetical protein [Acrocarpospora corrugata]|nr:hypothetical protein [Acrocarpospora corrugata]